MNNTLVISAQDLRFLLKTENLCFGDSLTWGDDPASVGHRLPGRWPVVLQETLGPGYIVIEEGQCGRNIATDNPPEGEKNGLKYIESGSPVQSLHASTHSSLQSAFDHAVRVEKLYEGMGKRGYTVDDLIDAYNRGCQQAFDFSLKFFFSAYAIALNENGRDIMEALNSTPLPKDTHTFPLGEEKIAELARRGITKKDLKNMEVLGVRQVKKEIGVERLLKVLGDVEDDEMLARIQEIMDEEIVVADIIERCKRETGVDIVTVLAGEDCHAPAQS